MQTYSVKEKIYTLAEFQPILATWKFKSNAIVFTNGCFDILHEGHLTYLEAAKNRGDKLVVGVNSDSSVKRLKGEERPINSEEFRAHLLASLHFVDAVILFEEDTPAALIDAIIPQVLVKGGDYEITNIVGYETVIANGGEVTTIPLVEGFSTTQFIEKIKNLNA